MLAPLERRELLFRRVILIYQMPKIGSQTIEATLRQCSVPHPIYRFHYLSRTMAQNVRNTLAASEPSQAWKRRAREQLNLTCEFSRLIRFRKWLRLCGFPIPKLDVISGVRDLVGLVLASLFENYLRIGPSVECLTTDKCNEHDSVAGCSRL